MKILNKKEIYSYTNEDRENYHSLLRLTDASILSSEYIDLTINEETKTLIKRVVGDLNYRHHNESNFFDKVKDIFSINSEAQVIEGQEDTAVILHNNIGLIFKSAEPGVFLSVKCKREDIEKNMPEVIELLETIQAGFSDKHKFEAIMLMGELKDTLNNKEHSGRKMKI